MFGTHRLRAVPEYSKESKNWCGKIPGYKRVGALLSRISRRMQPNCTRGWKPRFLRGRPKLERRSLAARTCVKRMTYAAGEIADDGCSSITVGAVDKDWSANDNYRRVLERHSAAIGLGNGPTTVTIVGGGMAGLGCLRALRDVKNVRVNLFESTRVLGGRVRSRRRLGALSWDVGTPHFSRSTFPGSEFASVLDAAAAAGVVEPWLPSRPNHITGGRSPATAAVKVDSMGKARLELPSFAQELSTNLGDQAECFVGVPDMGAVPVFIADELCGATRSNTPTVFAGTEDFGLHCICEAYVDRIHVNHAVGQDVHKRWEMMIRVRTNGSWTYTPWSTDVLIIATNAPAAAKLMSEVRQSGGNDNCSAITKPNLIVDDIESARACLEVSARSVGSETCWILTIAFSSSLGLSFDALNVENNSEKAKQATPITWLANNSSKPGRPRDGQGASNAGWGYRWAEICRSMDVGEGECWVVRASPIWSKEHAHVEAGEIARTLQSAFLELVQREHFDIAVCHCSAFRWNHRAPSTSAVKDDNEHPYMFYEDLKLGAVGDWTTGEGTGAAFDGGYSLGCALAKCLTCE